MTQRILNRAIFNSSAAATLLGFGAILLWSTTIACSRSVAEQIGPFTAAAVVYGTAGLLGCAWMAARGQLFESMRRAHRGYLWGCGGLMVVYTALLYWAVGMSSSREQVIAVTVANYLWPSLTLVLAVPILRWSCHPWRLTLGTVLALTGVGLVMGVTEQVGRTRWAASDLSAVMIAGLAAIAWATYSNLSRRWAGQHAMGAMPLFLLVTGIVLALVRCAVSERSTWSVGCVLELAYLVVFPTLLAYVFWDHAARCGNLALLAAASYLTPVLSVWVSSLYLRLSLSDSQRVAAGLVVAGAVLCRAAIRLPNPIRQETDSVDTGTLRRSVDG